MEVNYKDIKSLILDEKWENSQVKLKFKTNDQNPPIETIGFVVADAAEIQKSINKSTKKTMIMSTVIAVATSLIAKFFGKSPLAQATGGVTSMAASTIMMKNAGGVNINTGATSPKMKEEAIVNAFRGVSAMYEYNNGKWQFKQVNN